jgi:hemolysin III
MSAQTSRWKQYFHEILNSVTHGIGALLAIAGLVLLLVFASVSEADPWRIVSFSIYGVSLVLMFSASTLYHAFQEKKLKALLNKLDHASIYVLIAGTYTPFTLVSLRGPWGWTIFGVIWALALAGVVFKLFFYTERLRLLSALLYVGMGWLIVVALAPLVRNVPAGGLYWLLAGGLAYSGGVLFYIRKKNP